MGRRVLKSDRYHPSGEDMEGRFRMSSNSKGNLIWWLVVTAGIVGVVLAWFGMGNYRKFKDWPTAEGTITASKMYVPGEQKTDGPPQEGADILFSYTVGGVDYISGRINPGFAGAEGLVEKYPVGTKITINYDPDEPAVGWFDAAGHSRWYLVLGGSLVLVVAGGALAVRGLKKK